MKKVKVLPIFAFFCAALVLFLGKIPSILASGSYAVSFGSYTEGTLSGLDQETIEFYSDIPAGVDKVILSALGNDCVRRSIDLCGGSQERCEVSATPGSRIYFNVSFDITPCGSSPSFWYRTYVLKSEGSGSADSGFSARANGEQCSANNECQSGYCNNGYCCTGNVCCATDSNCASDAYCGSDYICYFQENNSASCNRARQCKGGYCTNNKCSSSAATCGDYYCDTGETCASCLMDCGICKKADGASCDYASLCQGGYCNEGRCGSSPYYCGNAYCDAGETCTNCARDCGACPRQNGAVCDYDDDCASKHCVHGKCRAGETYCGDSECDAAETCKTCARDCGACDSAACTKDSDCAGGHCVHKECRSETTYCGDDVCDLGETCAKCQRDCCGSDLRVSFSVTRLQLKPGDTGKLEINFKNVAKSAADNVYWSILVDKDELLVVSPKDKNIGTVKGSSELSKEIKITAKSAGTAYLAVHIRGDNFGSILKFVQVNIEGGLALDVPESIFLLPQEENEFGVFVINQGSEPAQVKGLTLESMNPSVVEIKEGRVMEVRGQGQGIKPDQLFTTESEDILKTISPRPKIQGRDAGETELIFKLQYYLPGSNREESLEKRTKVKVGAARGGKQSLLDLQIIPAGIALEIGEARELKLVLKNEGSEIVKQGVIKITKPKITYFESTAEVRFGFIEPGQEATAKIDLVATDEFPPLLKQFAKEGELAITDPLSLTVEYQTVDGRKFQFQDEIKVSLVEKRSQCKPSDPECVRAVNCLVELSNAMSCTLELADVIPYLDKPVAVVLATADVCEIGQRKAGGDSIGAAVSALLMASDIADNAADAVPGAGNLASTFADIVEGAADCAEGFVHSGVDQYCAGGSGKGYTGCAENIFKIIAEISGKAGEPTAVRKMVVAMVGSPVAIAVVDSDGKVLTPRDGVVVLQQGELKFILIKNPQDLTGRSVNFKITGEDNGQYSVQLGLIDNGSLVKTREIKNKKIKQDEEVLIPLSVRSTSSAQLTDLLVGKKEVARLGHKGFLDTILDSPRLSKSLLAIFVILLGGASAFLVLRKIKQSKR